MINEKEIANSYNSFSTINLNLNKPLISPKSKYNFSNTSSNLLMQKNENKLSNPKILNLFVNCLKSLHKQQENKKKNYKKLMNLFSVRVQKYDDSSSHNKTDEKFKVRKGDLGNKLNKKKKNYTTAKSLNNKNKKKVYDSSNMEIEEINTLGTFGTMGKMNNLNMNMNMNVNMYQNYNTLVNHQVEIESMNEDDNQDFGLEYNSDSSIFTHNKEIIYTEDEEENPLLKRRVTKSMNKNRNILSERAKFIKHKFNKQVDFAKSKKFCREDRSNDQNLREQKDLKDSYPSKDSKESKDLKENFFSKNKIENENTNSLKTNPNLIRINPKSNISYNINIDTSVYNSYKSANSNDKKFSENIVNYYLINSIEEDKDLIFYNQDENYQNYKNINNYSNYNSLKYDENIQCYYSLDHTSRIIYIKPSPQLLSHFNSIINSKMISNKATHNISNEESVKSSQTPRGKENQMNNLENNVSLNILNFNHNIIIEKLKNLELMRKDKDVDVAVSKTIISSDGEYENDSENNS
jgi:hypothetical protein